MKLTIQSLKLFIFMTLLTGLLYPLSLTWISQQVFPVKANGSIINVGVGKAVGSELVAQKFEKPIYFWPRPSSADFVTLPSGSSNLGPTSGDLKKQIEERRTRWGGGAVPQDLLTASGSGLDPHISPEAAYFQLSRVAKARNLGPEGEKILTGLIASLVEKRDFGVMGEPRVNVLKLNLALDKATVARNE